MDWNAVRRLLLTLALLVGGCAPATPPAPTAAPQPARMELTVFAAASLAEAFRAAEAGFEARHPHVGLVFNFAGSNALARQLVEGAPADVFASAHSAQMDSAIAAGRVAAGAPQVFAYNRLVVVVPAGPRGAGRVQRLPDLARPGVLIVLAAAEVPVGQYSLDFLDKAAADPGFGPAYKDDVLANVVSYEQNVRTVLTKITLGEGDAGIVYTSDVAGDAAGQVERLDIPDALNTIASYPIAPVADSQHAEMAQAFVDYLLSPEGQALLAGFGFIVVE